MINLGIREYLIGESITWVYAKIPDWIPKILAGYTYGCSQHEKSTGCLVKTILVKSKKIGISSTFSYREEMPGRKEAF